MKHDIGRYGMVALGVLFLCGSFSLGQTQTATKSASDKSSPERAETPSWFKVQEVAEGVWRIYDDHGSGNMYLVAGRDKALLIDTGIGAADLLACVRQITRLPVTVVDTHGHPDHVGGNFQFEAVSAHPDDFERILRFAGRESREGTIQRVLSQSSALEPLVLKTGGDFDEKRLVPVRAGHVFDLGGTMIEVIETPGHSKGSLCLLDKRRKLLFTGDTTNALVWLFLRDCLPLEAYLQTLRSLRQRGNEYDTILPGHGDPLEGAFVGEQIACAESILSGACKGEPYQSFAGNALLCSYKRARIAYDPGNLQVKR